MDSIGDGVRRSVRIFSHRLAEDEPEIYISIPGKKRFKKDSRTWLHKSSKRAEAKRAKEAKKLAACSPVKGIHLISPLKDAAITLDGTTEKDKSEPETPQVLLQPNKAIGLNTTGKSFLVIQERNRPTNKRGKSAKVHTHHEDSNTIDNIVSKESPVDVNSQDIAIEDNDKLHEGQGTKRQPPAFGLTVKKRLFGNIESVALSDSELCLRADRLALVCCQDLSQTKTNNSDPPSVSEIQASQSNSSRSENNNQVSVSVKGLHFKTKLKRVVVSKVGRKMAISGCKKLKTPANRLISGIKPTKNKICSKRLKKKACKHLAKKNHKQKLSAKMLKGLKSKTSRKSVDKDKKTSNTTVSSRKEKSIKRKNSSGQLEKRTIQSLGKPATGDSKWDEKGSRCAKLALKRYNSFTTSLSECTIPSIRLVGGLSDIALGRSISEAGMSALESRDDFLQRRNSSGMFLLSGKSSRSAERLVPVSLSRKSLDSDTGIRKRKVRVDDRSSSTSVPGASFQQKRSRESVFGGKRRPKETKVKQLSRQGSFNTTSIETFSNSESSLQVQCSITTGLLEDVVSCASSTVVEQGSFCSLGCCTSAGCLSCTRVDDPNSSSHPRTLKDEHYFNLTASPGNHCLSTIDLHTIDLPMENDFVSAHKLHRSKALATTPNLQDDWQLVSKSDSSIHESEILIRK